MKIAFFLDYFQPKLGYSEYYVAKELQNQGHTIQIITSDRYFPFPDYQASVKKFLGSRIRKPAVAKEHGLLIYREKVYLELFARVLYGNQNKRLSEFLPDVVIVNGSTTWNTITLSLLKKTYNYRLISFDSHLPSELFRTNVVLKKVFYSLFRLIFSKLINSRVDKFIAVQKKTIPIMRRYYGIKNKIFLIPLGTDTESFHGSLQERNMIRRKHHIMSTDFVLLYTGKIITSKKVDLLFKAFNTVRRAHQNIKLMIVGEGPVEYVRKCYSFVNTNYRKDIRRIPLQRQSDLHKYYSSADVGIWPAQESTSMIDAQACRLPVLADDTVEGPQNNKNIIIFRKNDAQDLRDKIEYVYLHPAFLQSLASSAYKDIVKNRSWKIIARQYIT